MKTLRIITAILLALLAVGCCSVCKQRIKNARPLEGTTWHLVQLAGKSMDVEAERFYMTLADGRITGIGACNHFFGEYALGTNRGIRFEKIGSTKMACPDMEKELNMFLALDATTHYDIDYDMLMLISDGVIKAIFKASDK